MEISGITIPYLVGPLDKFPSKSVAKIGHIEVPLWQGFPRNSSETQLSAFKQASKFLEEKLLFPLRRYQQIFGLSGNKAFSSVTSHFSRLKPSAISRNLSRSPNKKKEVSGETTEQPSVESQSPNVEPLLPSSYSSLTDLSSYTLIKDVLFLPQVGVLFLTSSGIQSTVLESNDMPSAKNETRSPEKPSQPKVLLRCVSAGQFDSHCLKQGKRGRDGHQLSSHDEHVRLIVTPEIQISTTDGQSGTESNTQAATVQCSNISQSSKRLEPCDVESNLLRASSETSLGSSPPNTEMKNSKSDHGGIGLAIGSSVLESFKLPVTQGKFSMNILTSPTAVKGNPLVMLAKGVQNLGANLDPRKMLDSKKESCTGKDKINENVAVEKLCTNTRIIRI